MTLSELRGRLGLSQRQCAERLGVSASYVGDLESGRRSPSLDWLFAAAEALGVDPHDLDPRLHSRRCRTHKR